MDPIVAPPVDEGAREEITDFGLDITLSYSLDVELVIPPRTLPKPKPHFKPPPPSTCSTFHLS